jgi:hypothetical protein
MEADAPFGWIRWRLEQRQQFSVQIAQCRIVLQQRFVDLCEPRDYCSIGCNVLAQANEGAHDKDAHLHRSLAAQDIGGHQGAVLGEDPWAVDLAAMQTGTGRKLRPVMPY